MAEKDVSGSVSPMIIASAHKDQPMNADRASSILDIEQVKSIKGIFLRLVHKILAAGGRGIKIPKLLRVDTVAGNWYLLERIDGQWLLKSGTGGLPKGITFTEIRDGQLYTADGRNYTQKLIDIFETDERGRPIKSLK